MTAAGFRRLLVAVDASTEGPGTLDAAARLAIALGADLHSLFVEDADALHMAALPFTRVIGHGPISTTVEPDLLERLFRRRAAAGRAALEAVAAERPLNWSYRVVRGAPAPEILAAANAEGCDLLIVQHRGLATVTRAAISRCQASVLCLQNANLTARHVVAFSPTGQLDLAFLTRVAQFTRAAGRDLTILYGQAPQHDREDRPQLAEMLDRFDITYQARRSSTLTTIRDIARIYPDAIVVVQDKDVGAATLTDQLSELPDRARCSILVLR